MIPYLLLIIVVMYCFYAVDISIIPLWIVILAFLSVFIEIIGLIIDHFADQVLYEDSQTEDDKGNDS